MRFTISVLTFALLLPNPILFGQQQLIKPGSRARIAYDCAARELYSGRTRFDCLTVTGRVAALSVDSVVLNGDWDETRMTVPFNSMARFEMAKGERSLQLKTAGTGLFAGGVLGLAWAGVRCTGETAQCADTDYALHAGALAIPFTALGAYLGNVWREHWEDVPLSWVRLSALRQPEGMSFGLSVNF